MMQRCCTKLRSLAAHSSQTSPSLSSSSRRLLLLPCSPHLLQPSRNFGLFRSILNPSLSSSSPPLHRSLPIHAAPSFSPPLSLLQVRHVSARERKKWKFPMTPAVSKVKKIKIKCYSSFKSRFRTLSDGTIRRWRAGKRHNAHQKSKKSKHRLRQPSIVSPGYAKVMKKLGFCA